MERWRRKGDKCNQEVARTKFNYHNRKPPVGMILIFEIFYYIYIFIYAVCGFVCMHLGVQDWG
ncbi:hypothetical protein HanOQP8_Chr10g0361761 [Helianthus annuus]|nr:hypothetical protein HanOQP8_Chr10g0361761 [Helianthus annuus]